MKTTKKDFTTIVAIAERAEKSGIAYGDSATLLLDLECAAQHFNLRLQELLTADDFNFYHDICGIQNCINRGNKTFEYNFIPRFAR